MLLCVRVTVCACCRACCRAGYSCQSLAEEEEATFGSFSPDLLALCNRSEPLPGSAASMLTATAGSGKFTPSDEHRDAADKVDEPPLEAPDSELITMRGVN